MAVEDDRGRGERGREAQRGEGGTLPREPGVQRGPHAGARLGEGAQLLGDVGHTTRFAASGGGGGAVVATRSRSGASVSWPMAETMGVRHAAATRIHVLVGEGQQVLDGAGRRGR